MDKSAFGQGNVARALAPEPCVPPSVDSTLTRVIALWPNLPTDARETIIRIAEVWATKACAAPAH